MKKANPEESGDVRQQSVGGPTNVLVVGKTVHPERERQVATMINRYEEKFGSLIIGSKQFPLLGFFFAKLALVPGTLAPKCQAWRVE